MDRAFVDLHRLTTGRNRRIIAAVGVMNAALPSSPRSSMRLHTTLAALTLLALCVIVAATTALAKPPEADSPARTHRIATYSYGGGSDQSTLIISQIDPSGIKELGRIQANYSDLLWLDGHKLLALEHGEKTITIQTFVDGRKEGKPLAIPIERFTLKKGETPPFQSNLTQDKKGGLWLEGCIRWDEEMGIECKTFAWLRIDHPAGTASPMTRKAPAGGGYDRARQRGLNPAKMPKLGTPKGFAIKLHKIDLLQDNLMTTDGKNVAAFTCTSPSGATTWPNSDVMDWEFQTRPKTTKWLMHTPPLLWIQGPATNPIAMTAPSSAFFLGCSKDRLEDVVVLAPDLWMKSVMELVGDDTIVGNHWVIYRGDTKLGAVKGDTMPFASTGL